ncbi:FAD-dependent monooxygenase [Colwelliaceae bacterium 6471]
MENFDCVVVGGGMVGAASALSLAHLGLRVAVIEHKLPRDFSPEQAFDLRVSAISLASQQLLEQLGAWQQISQWRNCRYSRLGVWEKDSSYVEFNAKDIGETHLGHILENRLIQLSLWQKMQADDNITLYCPETLLGFEQSTEQVLVTLEQGTITGKVLIAADGAHSKVRQLAGIGCTGWDYQQSAMLINVTTQCSQQDITWQQFFETGPVAMLPMPGHNASLVWYHHKEEIKRLQALSNQQLAHEISGAFPERLGAIKVLAKGAFPLTRRHANQYVQQRVVLIGDAAHSINPMAGQGVNLGFKDVKALQMVIASAIGNGESWHSESTLKNYEGLRRKDNLMMMSTMDLLYAGFSHPSPLIKSIRNAGLMLTNRLPWVKNKALAYACGL